jgi:hypothetical protein
MFKNKPKEQEKSVKLPTPEQERIFIIRKNKTAKVGKIVLWSIIGVLFVRATYT